MKNKDTVSALIGGAFFAVPYLALSLPIIPSLAIGGAAFVAGELVFKKDIKEKIFIRNKPIEKILEEAKKQNKHILNMEPSIEDEEIKKNLKEINTSISKIIATVEKDYTKAKKLNNFFDYYLPLTVKIIDRYDEIENQKLSSKDSKKFINNTNDMVKEINFAFKKILDSLYQKDIIDTDAEMKVFNSMLKSDGFDSDGFNIEE